MDGSTAAPTMDSPFGGHFAPAPGYLAACTSGLPSRATVRAMHDFVDDWAAGDLDPVAISDSVERCRALYAGLAGVDPSRVAVGSQVSQLVSVVASALPDGAEVLCAEGDFASLVHPFAQLAAHGVRLRFAPLDGLADAVSSETSLVAFSLVQSADGRVAEHTAIREAAAATGARTLVDLTQSLGWLPIGAEGFDFTVCHAYKWLCAPRGTAFLTARAGLETAATPLAAGWCSADDVWTSCYAGHMPLAAGAGRFDLSPAWPSIAGTEAALRLLTGLDPEAVHAHDLGLANAARAMLGLPSGDSAIVAWADPEGDDLAAMRAAGIAASGRAGNARISFHLWNTGADVEALAGALGR